MQKKYEIANPNSCLNKAASDEPLFVLRAKDPLAAETVRAWARFAEEQGLHEPEKINEARMAANQMDSWRSSYLSAQD